MTTVHQYEQQQQQQQYGIITKKENRRMHQSHTQIKNQTGNKTTTKTKPTNERAVATTANKKKTMLKKMPRVMTDKTFISYTERKKNQCLYENNGIRKKSPLPHDNRYMSNSRAIYWTVALDKFYDFHAFFSFWLYACH